MFLFKYGVQSINIIFIPGGRIFYHVFIVKASHALLSRFLSIKISPVGWYNSVHKFPVRVRGGRVLRSKLALRVFRSETIYSVRQECGNIYIQKNQPERNHKSCVGHYVAIKNIYIQKKSLYIGQPLKKSL